jgi:hypothetical protein
MKYFIALILVFLMPSIALAQKAAQPAGTFMASPCVASGLFKPRVLCVTDLASIGTTGSGNIVLSAAPTLTGLSTLANMIMSGAPAQTVAFAGLTEKATAYLNVTAASAANPELATFIQMVSSTGSASGNGALTAAFKMPLAVQSIGHVGTTNTYGENIAVIMDSGVGNFSMSGLEIDMNNNNVDYPEGGAGGAVGVGISVLAASLFPIAAVLNVGTINTATYAFHDLINVPPNAFTLRDNLVHDGSSAIRSYNDTGAHAACGFCESATTPIGYFNSAVESIAGYEDVGTAPWGAVYGGTYSNGGVLLTNAPLVSNTYTNTAPTTGQTVTIPDNQDTAVLSPAGTIATLTLKLPTCSAVVIGKRAYFVSNQQITALTVTATAGGVLNPGGTPTLAPYVGHVYECIAGPNWIQLS